MESRRFWAAFALLCIGAVLMGIVAVVLAIPARAAEQPVCAPWAAVDKVNQKLGFKNDGIGVLNDGEAMFALERRPDGKWLIYGVRNIQGKNIACLITGGPMWLYAKKPTGKNFSE